MQNELPTIGIMVSLIEQMNKIYIFKFYFGKTSSDRSQMSRFLKQYIQLSRYLHKDIGKGNRRMGIVEEKD